MQNFDQLSQFAATLTPRLRAEFMSALHKIQYPMRDILLKIPGETIADKARAIPVSRQTMYVWQDEKFRPVLRYALKIAKLTGVPVDHIMEWSDAAGRPTAEKAETVASRSKRTSKLHGRAGRKKRRVVEPQVRSRSVRKVHERTGD